MSCFFSITTLHFESYLIPVVVRGGKNPSLSPSVLELQRPGKFPCLFGDSQSTPVMRSVEDVVKHLKLNIPQWKLLLQAVFHR